MATKENHWVEELFPPHFGFTLDELLPQKDKDQEQKTESILKADHDRDEKIQTSDSVFAKLARRVSPLDIGAIKNVYERVWLMTHLEEEERKKRVEEADSEDDESYQRTSTPAVPKMFEKKKPLKNAETSTSDINEKAPLDIHDPCIWSSKELDVLRAVFKTAQQQNTRLNAELLESQTQYMLLSEKYKKQFNDLEIKLTKAKETAKANERLAILSKNLKKQVTEATSHIDRLQKHIKSMEKEGSTMLKNTHELRVNLDRERLDRKKAELQLQRQTQEALREQRIHEENLKVMHDEDIQFLQKTIEDLTEELSQEKKDHERTKRGLDHLRQHFSSLPLHGERSSDGVVREDQLKQWTY